MIRTPDKEKLRVRMAGLCSRSEQCGHDITQKLYKAGLRSEDVREITDYLRERGFIDERRYARAFANDKMRFSGWGKRKIRAALSAKRVESNLISAAIEGMDDEEYRDVLLRVARAKARDLDLSGREDRAKLYRHLLARGFESAEVSRVLSKLNNEESD